MEPEEPMMSLETNSLFRSIWSALPSRLPKHIFHEGIDAIFEGRFSKSKVQNSQGPIWDRYSDGIGGEFSFKGRQRPCLRPFSSCFGNNHVQCGSTATAVFFACCPKVLVVGVGMDGFKWPWTTPKDSSTAFKTGVMALVVQEAAKNGYFLGIVV